MKSGSPSRQSGRSGPSPANRPSPSGPPKRTGSTPYLDIPPRTRSVMIVVGVIGMIAAVIGSLMATKGMAVEADKIVHFSGYTLMGTVMILGLRPILWPFGMLVIAGVSAALEMIQPVLAEARIGAEISPPTVWPLWPDPVWE